MSKLWCKCGHVISDVAYACPTEAKILGDKAYEKFDRGFVTDVKNFLDSIRQNRRSDWIANHFGEIYPNDLPDHEIISDLMMIHLSRNTLCISECEACGRIWVQSGFESNHYRSFSADDEDGYLAHLSFVFKNT